MCRMAASDQITTDDRFECRSWNRLLLRKLPNHIEALSGQRSNVVILIPSEWGNGGNELLGHEAAELPLRGSFASTTKGFVEQDGDLEFLEDPQHDAASNFLKQADLLFLFTCCLGLESFMQEFLE